MLIERYLKKDIPTLIMLIGISGSGKSTIAKEIKKQLGDRATILSTDQVREEKFGDVNDQTHNEEVFGYIHNKACSIMQSSSNQVCVVDATNLSVKDRRWVFCLSGMDKLGDKIALLCPTNFEDCLTRNSQRQRVVPEYVLQRQIRKFEVPFYEEGWDKILIWDVEDFDILLNTTYKNKIGKPDYLFNEMKDFDQKNNHHQFTLDVHCFKAYQELLKRTDNSIFLRAAQIHDIGKRFVQKPREDNPNYSYFNHHNYGAYYALSKWREIGIRKWMGINCVDDIIECLFYINYHMQPFFIQTEKSKNKYRNLWGEKKYNDLMMFNECDKIASGTKRE